MSENVIIYMSVTFYLFVRFDIFYKIVGYIFQMYRFLDGKKIYDQSVVQACCLYTLIRVAAINVLYCLLAQLDKCELIFLILFFMRLCFID